MNRHHTQHHKRYYAMGADAVPVVVSKPSPTISGEAISVVRLALMPVKWGLHTAGGLVRWLGNTVDSISYKL